LNTLQARISDACGEDNVDFVNASRIATKLLGNSIGANFFLTGFAWQRGLIPIPRLAIERAIELNGQAVRMNLEAFEWGRMSGDADRGSRETIDDVISNRSTRLESYQDRAYAQRYQDLVQRVRQAEAAG